MLIAKIRNNSVEELGTASELFPNTLFPLTGPSKQFLMDNNCLEVTIWKSHDHGTEKLVSCAPYIEGDSVYTVEVQSKTSEEIAADTVSRNLKLQRDIVNQTQARLDIFARTKNYDGILSACTYATDPNPVFAAEGQRCVDLRSETWATLYEILAEVESGTRPIPTGFSDIESELPVLTWQ